MRLAFLARRSTLLFVAATACFGSGGDDDDESGPYGAGMCEALVSKVTGCGVATGSGPVACGGNALSLCGVRCMLDASCSELEDLSCRGAISDTILDCFAACSESSRACLDGDGTFAPEQQCNGTADCADDSDELNCATFRCDDGPTIPVQERCDLIQQCADASDESGCAQLVSTCDNAGSGGAGGAIGAGGGAGELTYLAAPTESCDRVMQKLGECDTSGDFYFYCYNDTFTYDKCRADCFEAATCDEVLASACDPSGVNTIAECWRTCAGTAYFLCDETVVVPEGALCNGFSDCLDQTDEADCPPLPEYECPSDPGSIYFETDRCDEFNSCGTLPSADEAGCACLL